MAKISAREDFKAEKILEQHIKKSYEVNSFAEEWQNLPEIPSASEIAPSSDTLLKAANENDKPDDWNDYQHEQLYNPNLPHNIVDGPWPSKEAYIGAHYQILREDAIAPLRRAVAGVKKSPGMHDDDDSCIYTHVTMKGLLLSRTGVAFRVAFSHERAGKQIIWEQSKRLLQGNIVALTPANDMFRTKCKIAIVAARPLEGLMQNPPTVDLFWGDSDDAIIDPVEKYVMVEAREGYFEASRHMLVAMQKLMTEKFQLQNHIVRLDQDVKAPDYIEDQPYMDLSSLERNDDTRPVVSQDSEMEPLVNVDILRQFPKDIDSGMDESQMSACEKMLTSRVAIVQGPPGTGKTFVSISTLKVMIKNLGPNDPPIVVAAQTNHALDQLLNHILNFEPNIVRLGGRCDKANEAILNRTLYQLRMSNPNVPDGRKGFKPAQRVWATDVNNIKSTLESLTTGDLLTADILLKNRIITGAQLKSLRSNAEWEGESGSGGDIADWLTKDQMMPVPEAPPIDPDLPAEESDIELEQIEELEDELTEGATGAAEKEIDALNGEWLPFQRKFTGRHTYPLTLTDKKIKQMLGSKTDLYDIPVALRDEVYRFFEKHVNKITLRELQARLKEYQTHVNSYFVIKGKCNFRMIRHLGIKVVGCTTTGLAKYRGLLSALRPRTLLIEEAAETLEGKVIGGLMDSIEHLILVGDHQQLQAGCTVRALETAPYHMNMSMFERLVRNSIGFVMLNTQRRMIPDVRKLLSIEEKPFYENLQDHPSVLDRVHNRPPVEGMGGRDTWFFHHNWPEARGSDHSRYNQSEADMIARFFYYLCLNGVDPLKITILTFYNGQRKTIVKALRNVDGLKGLTFRHFNVFTVDSYQGEENDIILLSLVRSNSHLGIGFLDNKNRLVVSLSRARRGLYIFGDTTTMTGAESNEDIFGREPLWLPIVEFMSKQGRYRMDRGLPLTCKNHGKVTEILESTDFDKVLAGGCDQKCGGGLLPCGHPCIDTCHPFSHSREQCRAACTRLLTCGHKCSKFCRDKCYCDGCGLYDGHLQQQSRTTESIEFFGDSGPLGAAFGESPPKKSSMKRTESQQSIERHVTFAQATKGVFNDFESRGPGPATPRRSISTPSTPGVFGSSTSPPKRSDLRPTTPKNSRARSSSTQSRGGSFGPRTPINTRSGIGAANVLSPNSPGVQAWNNWDAKKADEELAERRRLRDEATPKVDPSTLVFRETFHPTTLNDSGERVRLSSSRRRVVARSEVGLDPLKASGSPTPKTGKGYSKNGKALLEGFQPLFTPNAGVPQPKTKPTRVNDTSGVASGMSGLSFLDKNPPAVAVDVQHPSNDEMEHQSFEAKTKKVPSTRGNGALDESRGNRHQYQPQPAGDLISWEDLSVPGSTAQAFNSEIDMGDLYGASPPRSRARMNVMDLPVPALTPAVTSSAPRQNRPAAAPVIAPGENSEKVNKSTTPLINLGDAGSLLD